MTPTEITRPDNLLIDRRRLMAGATALGLGLGIGPVRAADAPKKGGTLRMAMAGGSASDSLDPRTSTDSISVSFGYQLWNGLVEINSAGEPTGELLESWEAKPGAAVWIFNVRKGITFSNGKTMDADDVIYSINLHRGTTKSGARDMVAAIKDIRKLSPSQIEITLDGGNAEFPASLAFYQLLVVPDGFTDFSKPIGTGAFTLEAFEPGIRVITKAKRDYWKAGRGNFDGVEIRYIADAAARTQALVTGQVDGVNRLDPRTVKLLMKAPNVNVVRSAGTGYRYAFVAHLTDAPFDSLDMRLAMKYGIDRQKIIDTVFGGFATLGNDNLVAPTQRFFAKDLPQRAYDPDKAAFHFKKSGHAGPVELNVSDGAFPGAVDCAVLYQESLKKAGIDLNVKRVSGDGYWDNVWNKVPFCAVYWAARPTVDAQLTQTFASTSNWNDTAWKRSDFDEILVKARVELDESKRAQLYFTAQQMLTDEGGMISFAIGDFLDGYSKKVRGNDVHPRFDMGDQRIAEKGWFES
jgi:peptide/nickel transport system substrate-binding protein